MAVAPFAKGGVGGVAGVAPFRAGVAPGAVEGVGNAAKVTGFGSADAESPFGRIENPLATVGEPFASVYCGPADATSKRQKTGAVHDAGARRGGAIGAAASWSAVPIHRDCRFSLPVTATKPASRGFFRRVTAAVR